MPQITPDYTQQFLFPPAIEEWVPKDHPVRFLREFVRQLDLAELGIETVVADEGRPSYDPALLLSIWLYGYMAGIRSTRKLEAACRDHLPLLWLTATIQPDHNSLWRFWSKHKKAIKGVFKQTVKVAIDSGCVGLVLQAVDGTKLPAAASSRKGLSKEYMEKLLVKLEESVAQTEAAVEQQGGGEDIGYRLPEELTERQQLKERIEAGLAQIAEDGRKHYHPVEPQARRMEVGQQNRYAYNAQAVTDGKGIITAADLTNVENDNGQLVPMIEQARENTEKVVETLADGGYSSGADLKRASEANLPVLAHPAVGTPRLGDYASEYFQYDAAQQTVTCPRGRLLDREGSGLADGRQRYRCHHHDCPVRAQCTRDPKGRQIEVHPHTTAVQVMRAKLKDPVIAERLAKRSQIAERTFAQIKQHDGFRRFTVWGLDGVRAQWQLVCAAANLRILWAAWRERMEKAANQNNPIATFPQAQVT